MSAAGRDIADLEMIGGIRGAFPDERSVADLDQAMESIPAQIDAGFTAICFKPSQYSDDPADVGPLCRRVVERAAALTS